MKKFLPAFKTLALLLFPFCTQAQICNPSGNVVIFSNYDGGDLVINVDVNIPNLKIGIVSYEAVKVTITGTYVGNITAVNYSGYNNSPNTNCTPSVSTTTISGFPSHTINVIPPATMSDPDGYPYIICAWNCAGSTGGCNTPEQVEAYYQTMFGGSLYMHYIQYGCWGGTTRSLSAGGTCCLAPAAAPVANFTLSADTICVGQCISITDASTNAPSSWSWNLSGSTPGSSALQNPTACYSAPGSYNITLSATNGIGTDVETKSIVVHGVNSTATLTGTTMTAAASGAGYQWINCSTGLPVSGATSQSFTPATNGLYAVIVTQNGCTDTSACMNVTTLGIGQVFSGDEVSVYPNPTNGMITIEDKFGVLKNADLNIVNTLGERVYTSVLSGKQTIDLNNAPAGIYLLTVKTPDGTLVKKIVLE